MVSKRSNKKSINASRLPVYFERLIFYYLSPTDQLKFEQKGRSKGNSVLQL